MQEEETTAVEQAPEYEPSEQDIAAGVCPECKGTGGHHHMNCEHLKKEDGADLHGLGEQSELPDGHYDEERTTSAKLPPSAEALMGSDMLWLIAKLCHEVNRQFCAGVTQDFSHKPWDDAPAWQRQSVYSGVVHYLENPGLTPEQSHQAWLDYKVADGWTFGNTKNAAAKTHPNLVPFAQLHIHERAKDALFTAICKTMLGSVIAEDEG